MEQLIQDSFDPTYKGMVFSSTSYPRLPGRRSNLKPRLRAIW